MKTKDIINISLFATLLSVCAWISIPTIVPFTLQTFAVFLAMLVLGGKKGTIVVCIYMFLGIIGIPVFSAGTAGIGVVLGATGGYMIGWIFQGLIMWFTDSFSNNKKWSQIMSMILGLIACYAFGTLWFMRVYTGDAGGTGLWTAFSMCVLPFIIPDFIKMVLAFAVSKRIKNIIKRV